MSVSFENVTARWVEPKVTQSFKVSQGSKVSQNKTDPAVKKNGHENEKSIATPATLESLSADFPAGMLIGIIGPVGAGKSSLLQAILRELPLEGGSINVNGTISYASQDPWVFGGSVRQNILFGQKYDKERYEAVIKACALVKDFKRLPNGDRTVIGERGASLSGGQKARVRYEVAAFLRFPQFTKFLLISNFSGQQIQSSASCVSTSRHLLVGRSVVGSRRSCWKAHF